MTSGDIESYDNKISFYMEKEKRFLSKTISKERQNHHLIIIIL